MAGMGMAVAEDEPQDDQRGGDKAYIEELPEDEEVGTILTEMETMALEDLVGFLSHRSRLVRKGAMSAAAGLSGTGAGRAALIEKQSNALETMIGMIGDKDFEADALVALCNFCEEEEAVINITKLGAGSKIMQRILNPEGISANLEAASKLLANVSRVGHGRREMIGYVADGTEAERRKQMKELIVAFEKSLTTKGDPLAPLALFFENVASEPQGAKMLCDDEDGFPLASIAKGLAGSHEHRKIGAAGAVKNCCFQKDLHCLIAGHQEIAALLALPLVGAADLYDEEDKDGMYSGLASKCRLGGTISESVELRKMIYESLKLLTRTKTGRDYLRNEKLYPVLREVHKFEEGFEVPDELHIEMLEEIVEQTMLLDEPDVD